MYSITDGRSGLRLVFCHLPLTRIHPHALAAPSWPSRPPCRGASGRPTSCYSTARRRSRIPDLWGYADRLGLDRGRLRVDLAGRRVWQRVQADAESARESGARGTPTLFINGRRHLGGGYNQANLGAALATATTQR
jgi:hypothetical protein